MKRFRFMTSFVGLVTIFLVLSGSSCLETTSPTEPAQTGEQFCSAIPGAFGSLFFCPSSQSNLQTAGLPRGYLGFCQSAINGSIGIVGYSTTTYSGGASAVDTYSKAWDLCNALGTGGLGQCSAVASCTRR